MSAPALAGTVTLLRFALRRDRLRLPLWIAVGAGLVVLQSVSSQAVYDTPEDLAAYAASVGSNAATIALSGPPVGLDTVAGAVSFEVGSFAMLLATLMAMFTVGRHTRADEEAGRTELVRAARVGRHAPLATAVLLAGLACVVLAMVTGALTTASGLPAPGSFLLGAAMGAAGLLFAGLTAVAVQVTSSVRAAYGLVGTLFAGAFVLRAIGDVNGSWVSWASPLGWAQATHPYSGDRWAPLLLCLAATAVLLAAAVTLLDHRDLGSGMVAPRPGRATAGLGLRSPLGLAARLHRGALLGWLTGLALLGAVYGGLAQSVETLVADNPEARAFFGEAAADRLVDGYLGTTLTITALLAGAYVVTAVLRARTEEAAGRAEPVLATATSRATWLGSHVTVALVGSAAILLVAGFTTGLAAASVTGDGGAVLGLTTGALGYVPAVWVLAGATAALVGVLPRLAAGLAWGMVGYVLLATLLVESSDLPGWVDDLSPVTWTPTVPIESWSAAPLLVLAAVAAGLLTLAVGGFRRRDVVPS